MSAQTTLSTNNTIDISVSPYFDDYGSTTNKKYTHLLFKPSFAVQAREMNTLGSLMNDLHRKMGDFIFVEGSEVYPCDSSKQSCVNAYAENTTTTPSYVKLIDTANLDYFTQYVNVTGATSGASMNVWTTSLANDEGDPPTLYGFYNDATEFSNNEILNITGSVYTTNTALLSCTANTSLATIPESKFYIRGNILDCNAQTLVMSKYSSNVSYRVGLTISESIVDSDDDSTLLDNATGSYNYNSPGADRYKKLLTLDNKAVTDGGTAVNTYSTDTSNFYEMVRVVNGNITATSEQPQLNPAFRNEFTMQDMDFQNHVLQIKTKTWAELASYSGSESEIVHESDDEVIHVMDGSTNGGFSRSKQLKVTSGTPTVSPGYYGGDTFLDYNNLTNKPTVPTNTVLQGYHSVFVSAAELGIGKWMLDPMMPSALSIDGYQNVAGATRRSTNSSGSSQKDIFYHSNIPIPFSSTRVYHTDFRHDYATRTVGINGINYWWSPPYDVCSTSLENIFIRLYFICDVTSATTTDKIYFDMFSYTVDSGAQAGLTNDEYNALTLSTDFAHQTYTYNSTTTNMIMNMTDPLQISVWKRAAHTYSAGDPINIYIERIGSSASNLSYLQANFDYSATYFTNPIYLTGIRIYYKVDAGNENTALGA